MQVHGEMVECPGREVVRARLGGRATEDVAPVPSVLEFQEQTGESCGTPAFRIVRTICTWT